MEYVRPKRYVKYGSKKCRIYLENDFHSECAYCKFKEIISGINKDGWEIDHFKPVNKFKEWDGLNKYDNLFYACRTCNNNKNDEWTESLLNPCQDDIYDVHIQIDENCEVVPLTDRGKEYIEILKLNATQSVIRRKKIKQLKKIQGLVNQIEKNEEKIKECCIIAENPDIIERFQSILSSYNINSIYGLYEYDLDFKLIYNDKEIFCDFNYEDNIGFINHKKMKRILGEKVKDWLEVNSVICYILMDSQTEKVYYYEIKKETEEIGSSKIVCLDDRKSLEGNGEEFKKIFFA